MTNYVWLAPTVIIGYRGRYMATKMRQAQIITPEELPVLQRPLPQSWVNAAGMLRHHKKAMQRHLQKVRREWSAIPHS